MNKTLLIMLFIYSIGMTSLFYLENKKAYLNEQLYFKTRQVSLKYKTLYTFCVNTDTAKELNRCIDKHTQCKFHFKMCKFLYKQGPIKPVGVK